MSDVAVSTAPGPEALPPRRRRWLRRTLWMAGSLVVLLVLLVLALPTLLSTGWGLSLIAGQVNDRIQGKVEIGGLWLGWFTGQRIDNLRVLDPSGKVVLDIDRIDLPNLTLLSAVRGDKDFGSIQITGRKVELVETQDGSTTLAKALASRRPSPPAPVQPGPASAFPADLHLDLKLTCPDIEYVPQHGSPMSAHALSATVAVQGGADIQAKLAANVITGPDRGAVDVRAQIKDLFSPAGQLQVAKAQVDAKANLANIPLAPVDALVHLPVKLQLALGPMLNTNLAIQGRLRDLTAQVSAEARYLTANADLTWQGQAIVAKALNVRSVVTPELLAEAWGRGGPPFQLQAPATIALNLDQASTRLRAGGYTPDLASLNARGKLTVSDLAMDLGGKIGLVRLSDTSETLALTGQDQRLHMVGDFQTRATYADRQGDVGFHADLSAPVKPGGGLDSAQLAGQVQAAINNWPTAVIDQVAGTGGLVELAAGPLVSAHLDTSLTPAADGKAFTGPVTLTLKSQRLNGQVQGDLTPAGLHVQPGEVLDWHVDPRLRDALVARLAPQSAALGPWASLLLTQPTDIKVHVVQAQVPLSGKGVQAQVAVTAPLTVSGLIADVAGGPEVSLNAGLVLAPVVPGGAPAKPGVSSAPAGGAPTFTLALAAPNIDATLAGQLSDGVLTVNQAGSTHLTLTPQTLAGIRKDRPDLGAKLESWNLAQPATVSLQDLKVALPQAKGAQPPLTFSGKVVVDKLVPTGDPRLADTRIENLVVNFAPSTLAGGIDARVNAAIHYRKQVGKLSAGLKLWGLTGGPLIYKLAGRMDDFPVALADQVSGQGGLLTSVLGPSFTRLDIFDLSNTPQAPKTTDFQISANGQTLQASLGGHYAAASGPGEPAIATVQGQATLQLTPGTGGSFAALRQRLVKKDAAQIALLKPTTLQLDLKQVQVALLSRHPAGTLPIDAAQTSLNGSLSATPIEVEAKARGLTGRLSNFVLSIAATDLSKDLKLGLTSDYQAAAVQGGGQPLTGKLTSTTDLQNLINSGPRNVLTPEQMTLVTDTSATNLPMALIDDLAGAQGKLLDITGDKADLSLKGRFLPGQGGQADILFKSVNLGASVPASLDKNLVLTLRGNAVAQFKITDQIKPYLARMSELLQNVQSSANPVKLTMDASGTRIPLKPFNALTTQLQGVVDLGTLRVQRGGVASALVTALRLLGSPIEDRPVFDARFTPLKFTMKDGLLTTSDVWMDTGDLRLGAQSHLIFAKNNKLARVEVLTAVPGDTVLLVPGTSGRINPMAIYTTGAWGPPGTLKFDYTGLLTRIAGQTAAGRGAIGNAIGLGATILGDLQQATKKSGSSDPAWWKTATWPNRPAPVIPKTLPAPRNQPQQPPQQQPQQQNPANQILRGLLQGLEKK